MHKCVVCGNTYKNTSVNRPEVIYHGFPKDEGMRKKWLKVLGIDRCYDWHRICSDHFLKKNYKGAKYLLSNTIPQPYGYSSKYSTLSNDVETGNISPRRSSTLTTEDMSNTNMPSRTSRLGVQCSIKNCYNRLSKNLSLFGIPKDVKLRTKWFEKCNIKNDPSEMVISGIRVCSAHFERNCFSNIQLKNRLKEGAVPSLFLDNAPPNALPMSINDVPVLSTCEQFMSSINNEDAEQSEEENQNNIKDNTSMPNDDTSNSLALPNALPMSINDVPVLSTCEQFMSSINNEDAEQSEEENQNNIKDNTSMPNDDTSNSLALPNALPMSINDVPVLSTCEQFMSSINNEDAEQSEEENQNNIKDNTSMPNDDTSNSLDNTSNTVDLTMDDSSNDSLTYIFEPIEPIEQCFIMDVCNTEDVHKIIYEMSREVVLPSVYWKKQHLCSQNETLFCQQNSMDVIVKKVTFYSNPVPSIEVYGKIYDYTTPIRTKQDLEQLLENLDTIEKCYGRGGLIFQQCLGYVEDSSFNKCSACRGLLNDRVSERLKSKIEDKKKRIESLKKRMAGSIETVLNLRKAMARKRQLDLL